MNNATQANEEPKPSINRCKHPKAQSLSTFQIMEKKLHILHFCPDCDKNVWIPVQQDKEASCK